MDDPTLLSWIERGQNFAALLVAIGVAAEFVLGFMAGPARHRVDQIKDAEMIRLVDNSASLEKGAAEAKAAQQRVETALAQQKERTASAEKAASDAALALAKFKEPRSLSPERQDKLVADAKPFAGQNFAFAVFPDPEPQALTRVLDELLKSAGWNRVPAQIQRTGGVLMEIAGESAAQISDSGVDAYIALDDMESVQAQHAFCTALLAAGIGCENHRTPQLAGKTPRAITISIGKKP
jgi:hypothetical protein